MDKKIFQVISYLGLLLLTVFLAATSIFYIINYFQSKNEVPTPVVDSPQDTEPIVTSTTNPLLQISLIKPDEKYNITQNPYESGVYNQKSKRLALVGDFEAAELEVKGTLPNNDNHFLSINVGTESGVYNAVRSSANALNLKLTQENLGVFNTTSLYLKIDLMSPQTLAPTKEEFLVTKQSTKLTRFWDFIRPQPPAASITRMLIAPFNEKGSYTGTIQELNFRYSCKKTGGCKVAVCYDEPGSKCIKDNFGIKDYQEYIKFYGVSE